MTADGGWFIDLYHTVWAAIAQTVFDKQDGFY